MITQVKSIEENLDLYECMPVSKKRRILEVSLLTKLIFGINVVVAMVTGERPDVGEVPDQLSSQETVQRQGRGSDVLLGEVLFLTLNTHVHTCTHTHTHTYTCTHATHMHMHMHTTCTHTCTYEYTVYTHTHSITPYRMALVSQWPQWYAVRRW